MPPEQLGVVGSLALRGYRQHVRNQAVQLVGEGWWGCSSCSSGWKRVLLATGG